MVQVECLCILGMSVLQLEGSCIPPAQPSRYESMGVICQMHSLDDPIGRHSASRRARVPRGMRQANPGPAHLASAHQARGAGVPIVNAISGSHSGRRKSLLRLCTRSAVRGAVPPRDRRAPETNALVGLVVS